MQSPQAAPPRARSPFAAAFLSLLFPGLGQLYAGAPIRALGFAAAPILLIALGAGVVLRLDRFQLVDLVFNPFLLSSIFVVNIIALAYRLVAIIDAYRVAQYVNAHAASGDGRLGLARLPRNPLSVAGLLAVVLVMAGSHVVVARYDMLALDALTSGCIFISDQSNTQCDAGPTDSPGASGASVDSGQPTDSPTPEPSAVGPSVPEVSVPPWDGKQRLNILLIGADEQNGGHNTDSLITVSIDPVTKRVAMFSLPRDTVDVPVPAGPARSLWGSVYRNKINSFFINNRNRSDVWPGNQQTRGYNALKAMIGGLYGLDIKYFVEVNFDGFRQVVDALGGVTVNVQIPVSDDQFPAVTGHPTRLYIPSGLQHMNGAQALQYARSRHGQSSDFDRSARQQRLLLSLREQTDPQQILPQLPDLVNALKRAVRTDIPLDQLGALLGLASSIDTTNIRSYVFAPPLYSTDTCADPRGCVVLPKVDRIRAAVIRAFSGTASDEAQRQKLADEGAQIWVLNGTNQPNRGGLVAGYLEAQGLAASAPRQRPAGAVPAHTKIVVYNGAEVGLADTIAYLQKRFGVTVSTATDPSVRVDIVITIGNDTPDLQPPALN